MVTILIPVYNTAKFLRHCLDSIIAQTYQDLQVVLVDDGSTDESLAICQEYANKYPYIEVHHQANAGVAAARNKLLSHVTEDYVLFVDSDDWIEPQTVEYLVTEAQRSQADIVTCEAIINDQPITNKEIKEEEWTQEHVVYEFLRHVIFNGSLWNKLLKAEQIKGIQFAKGISYGEDALFIWQVLQRVQKVLITNRQLYHYRMNDTSLSHQTWSPDKKGSGSIVWAHIVEETKKNWPQYTDMAKARFALEDMWGLYFASLSRYKYDKHIHERQKNIRKNLKLIRQSKLVSFNKIIASYILGYWYNGMRLLVLLKNLLTKD